MSVRLFVGNLSYEVTEADLRTLFSEVGAVTVVRVPLDRETGRPRGFAFVDFAEREQGEAAIARFHQQVFKGRPLAVSEAVAREDAPRGPARGGYGGPPGGGPGGPPRGGGYGGPPGGGPRGGGYGGPQGGGYGGGGGPQGGGYGGGGGGGYGAPPGGGGGYGGPPGAGGPPARNFGPDAPPRGKRRAEPGRGGERGGERVPKGLVKDTGGRAFDPLDDDADDVGDDVPFWAAAGDEGDDET